MQLNFLAAKAEVPTQILQVSKILADHKEWQQSRISWDLKKKQNR